MNSKLESIKNSETFKQILDDSCGGIMYNVSNRDKYDDKEILSTWESMTNAEKESAGGIIKGAMEFLTDKH